MTFPKAYADAVARLRVPMGFVLAAAFAWLSAPNAASLAAGVPVSVAGLWLRAWAAGHLTKNQRLATGGPYAYVRNPLYVGTVLVAAGLAIASRRIELAALFGAVFAGVYLPVVELEEQHLRALFPEYAGYQRRVPKLLPSWRGKREDGRFQLALYRKNQEYQALLGFLTGLAWLLWKASRG